jgi:hypothetical protein
MALVKEVPGLPKDVILYHSPKIKTAPFEAVPFFSCEPLGN